MQIASNLSAISQHSEAVIVMEMILSSTCLSISVAEANSEHECKIIIRSSTYLTEFTVMSLVHRICQCAPWSWVFMAFPLVADSCQNAVVTILFTPDIWRSLKVSIKFFLCQLRNTTQFSSWFDCSLKLPYIPGVIISRLYLSKIVIVTTESMIVIAMIVTIECHNHPGNYTQQRNRLVCPIRWTWASEWKTPSVHSLTLALG